ncbi:MAG TPA: SpoIIE family protein phosphatase [Thermoanaerobaculia bacterium]|nr:SpoIIE family protein phosphatase [Thermoanaerobaculia bacterium]
MTVNAQPWSDLEAASDRDWESGAALARALDLWCETHGARAAALFAPVDGSYELVQGSRRSAFERHEQVARWLELPGGFRLAVDADPPPAASLDGLFSLLLCAAGRLHRVHERLKEQEFAENYKVVTLEALYDVGLAVASTLDLEQLCEEILLRAVSLLDARRGAFYLAHGGAYTLRGTIGGEALPSVPLDDPGPRSRGSEADGGEGALAPLPGASYPLTVAIAYKGKTKGLLAVADKESRTGVGPFSEADRRALELFATQAAIALENANLHRQALEKERLEREMQLAAEIQRGILPVTMPCSSNLEIVGWNRPTRQVGGDYYGSVSLENGALGVVVADVTGKGMPAALLVSTLHSALHLLLDKREPNAELLSTLNQHIVESSGSNKFITMILVDVDPAADALGYLNAGHNPGLVVRRDGTVEELAASGLPLGLLPGARYQYRKLRFSPGDLVCLYSDGITECAAPDDDEFGQERLSRFLVERREAPLSTILQELDQAVTVFAAGLPQGDDQTVVLMRRGG